MQLTSMLDTLESAGVVLAPGVETADIDDAVFDHATLFQTRPFAALSALAGPDGDPLFALASPGSLASRARRACTALGATLIDLSAIPDTPNSTTGSARVQFSEWDVADVEFDGDSPVFELGILAAIENRGL